MQLGRKSIRGLTEDQALRRSVAKDDRGNRVSSGSPKKKSSKKK